VRGVFTAASYNLNYALCATYAKGEGKEKSKFQPLLTIPDCSNHETFKKWIDDMADITSPELLGLPANAELMLRSNHGRHMATQLLNLQDHVGGDDVDKDDEGKSKLAVALSSDSDGPKQVLVPPWQIAIAKSIQQWTKRIPQGMRALPSGKELENMQKNPVFRCVQREFNSWRRLLNTVLGNMKSLVAVSEAKEKATNPIRDLFKSLRKEKLPQTWTTPAKDLPLGVWVEDLSRRIEHMQKIAATTIAQYGHISIWLGGFFTPEAFVAATRQAVAQAHSWSLEALYLRVTVNDTTPAVDSFTFEGMTLYGASWKDGALAIGSDMSCALPAVRFTWLLRANKTEAQIEEAERKNGEFFVTVPVYVDASRQNFLFTVRLRRPVDILPTVWSQRGTCLTVWTSAL